MEGQALRGPPADPRQPAELGDEALEGRGVHDAAGGYGAQRAVNSVWTSPRLVAAYEGRALRPVEVIVLVRHREGLSGRVLEVGCGAGRVSGYLLELADEFTGIDLSPAMLAHCRRRYPSGRFELGDLRALPAGPWEAIVAPYNVLDVVEPEARGPWLEAAHAALSPGGLLVFSGHNLAAAAALREPWALRWRGILRTGADLARLAPRVRNRRRLKPLERRGAGWAVLNDSAHAFSLLHFYTGRDEQERALAARGFVLEECLDLEGHRVEPGAGAPESPELHYVARRVEPV